MHLAKSTVLKIKLAGGRENTCSAVRLGAAAMRHNTCAHRLTAHILARHPRGRTELLAAAAEGSKDSGKYVLRNGRNDTETIITDGLALGSYQLSFLHRHPRRYWTSIR